MDELRRNLQQFIEPIYAVAVHVIPILSIFLTAKNWNEMSSCYQREATIICCFLIYWQFAKPAYSSAFVWELFQFAFLFWIVNYFNTQELFNNPQCMDVNNDITVYALGLAFTILLYTYSIICLIFLVFFTGGAIYLAVEHHILEPRRRRRALYDSGLISKLNKTEYHPKLHLFKQGKDLCSICLNEFLMNESIIVLPGCQHYYHDNCINQWLKTQKACPYCRADIVENIKQQTGYLTNDSMAEA